MIFRSFEIVFEVINGAQNGYVAIDDIVYSGCADQTGGQACGSTLFTCDTGNCVFLDEVSFQEEMSYKLHVYLLNVIHI